MLTKKGGTIFRVGIFLDFVRLATRTPHGAYVRRAKYNPIDRDWGEIERLTTRTVDDVKRLAVVVVPCVQCKTARLVLRQWRAI